MKKLSIGLVVAVAMLLPSLALAKDGDVIRRGTCTGATTWKLKLSEEDGRIEVEFEVDQNVNGVRWKVAIFQNGKRIARMTKVTRGPSGSFEARVLAPNRSGADAFRARATRASGEVCAGRASF